MVFERMALKSFSWATMGLALAGVASGQDVDTGAAAGINTNSGQDNASAAANIPGANVGVSLDAKADANRIGANGGVQTNDTRAGAELNADGNVNGSQNRANSTNGQGANLNANRDAFGVTFDSSVTDGLVIQQALPNSAASRIGLRAGDRIIGVNGRTYRNADGFNTELDRFNSNSDTPIIYEREGRLYTQNFRLSSQNGVRNSSGPNYGSQSYSGQMSHSVGRPIYGVSDSMPSSGTANAAGDYGQAGTGGYSHGGSSVYQSGSFSSGHCCQPCGGHHNHHGRRGRHGRSWR